MVFQQNPWKKSRFHLLTDWSGTRPAMVRPASSGKSGPQMELERPKNFRVFLLSTLRFLEVWMFTFFSPFWALFIDKDSLSFWSQKWWRKVVSENLTFSGLRHHLYENVWQAIILEFREKKCEKTPSKLEKPRMTEQIISLNRFRSIWKKLPLSFSYCISVHRFLSLIVPKAQYLLFCLGCCFRDLYLYFSHVFRLG